MSTLAMPSMEQVLALAELCPVFPVRVWKDAQTGKLRKAPAINGGRGHLDASRDRNTVIDLFMRANGWNAIGVPTGLASGFDVLDGDEQHPSAREWLHANPLPPTRIHRTPSGGRHFFLAHRDGQGNFTDSPVKGIDGRGDGGWVVWWPANGLPVENPSTLASWPAELQTGLRGQAAPRQARPAINISPMSREDEKTLCVGIVTGKAYARKRVPRETWLALPRNLVQLGVSESAAWAVWDAVYEGDNKEADTREAEKWMDSGGAIGAGSLIAQCKDKLTGGALTILTRCAAEYQQKISNAEFRKTIPISATSSRAVPLATYEAPPVSWRVANAMPCIGTGFFFSSYEKGKTGLVIDLAVAMASPPGQPWANLEVTPLAPDEFVMLVAFEDPGSLKARLHSAARHRDVLVPNRVLVLTVDSGKQAVAEILAEIDQLQKEGRKCRFIPIDTWSAARFTLDDNNANEVAAVIAEFNKAATKYETCFAFMDHIVKNNETGRNMPRGSSAKLADTSFGYALNDGVLMFERVKNSARPKEAKFEFVEIDGAVAVKWHSLTLAERFPGAGSSHNKDEDIKRNIANYALGTGIENDWNALDAGKFVKFNSEVHRGCLQSVSDDVIPGVVMVCTKGVFRDALAKMFTDGESESAMRVRMLRLRDRGLIVVSGTHGSKVPLVLMRGEGWLPQNPWAAKNNSQKMPWDA